VTSGEIKNLGSRVTAVRRRVAAGCAATLGCRARSGPLDNLFKPTLDAIEGVFGLRRRAVEPQPADDRVDRLEAVKPATREEESRRANIHVYRIG
jgi:hypothetical protein